jgi:hypothetical protein
MRVGNISSRDLHQLDDDPNLASADVLMVMPYTDRAAAERCATLMAQRAGTDGVILCVHDADHEGFITLVNRVFSSTASEYFGYVAQDAFAGRRWLVLAIDALRKHDKGLFAFNDGKWMGMLASFGIASRAWISNIYDGHFFFPGYGRHYADVELSVLAMSARSYCYDPNSILVEVDWHKDSASTDPKDKALYQERRASGFNGRVTSRELLQLFS